MPQSNISILSGKQKPIRYVLPIQSFGQIWLAIVDVGLYALFYFLVTKLLVELLGLPDKPVKAFLIFGVVMVYFHLYMMLPAHFTIAGCAGEKEHLLAVLDREIGKLGYEAVNFDEHGW